MMDKQRVRVTGVALLAGVSMLVAGCTTVSGSAASGPAASGPVRSVAVASRVVANLPVVRCPTAIGIAPAPRAVSLPASRRVPVPAALAARLSVYADTQGVMELLGPRGWSCAAFYGADGSGGVVLYPRGGKPPRSWTAGWRLARTSAAAAVTGLETSACYTCTLAQACPLFAAAATALHSYLGRQVCPARPAAERVTTIGAGIKGFLDPPGTSGDGVPSGGLNAGDGVMTYHPRATAGSWLETCTLPARDKAECVAILGAFVAWYGQR